MSTNQLSPENMHRSRNMQSDILHAVAEVKQVNVAKCFGVESSTVGRWIDSKNPDSQVVRFCDMLAICGLKIVPENAQCYNKDKIGILFHITKDYFQNLEAVDDFFQGDAGMSDSRDIRFSRVSGLSESSTTRNILFELLLRCMDAGKSLLTFNVDRSETARLIARQQIEDERLQEIKDKASDEALLWKLIYVVVHVIAAICALSITYKIWG